MEKCSSLKLKFVITKSILPLFVISKVLFVSISTGVLSKIKLSETEISGAKAVPVKETTFSSSLFVIVKFPVKALKLFFVSGENFTVISIELASWSSNLAFIFADVKLTTENGDSTEIFVTSKISLPKFEIVKVFVSSSSRLVSSKVIEDGDTEISGLGGSLKSKYG